MALAGTTKSRCFGMWKPTRTSSIVRVSNKLQEMYRDEVVTPVNLVLACKIANAELFSSREMI